MAWYLTREYGKDVEVNYLDLSQPSVRERHPIVLERLKKGELVLPAVFVDDAVVGLGYVDYFSIARAIEQARPDAGSAR